jgi:hypothetical protein
MRYTLTTSAGNSMVFYILECAQLFQAVWGGIIEEIYDDRVEFS